MVEGGAILQGSFLQEGLADELHVYIGACMLGSTSKRWAQTELTGTIADARFWRRARRRRWWPRRHAASGKPRARAHERHLLRVALHRCRRRQTLVEPRRSRI